MTIDELREYIQSETIFISICGLAKDVDVELLISNYIESVSHLPQGESTGLYEMTNTLQAFAHFKKTLDSNMPQIAGENNENT